MFLRCTYWFLTLEIESQPPQTGAGTPGLALPVCWGQVLAVSGVIVRNGKKALLRKAVQVATGRGLRGRQELLLFFSVTIVYPNTCPPNVLFYTNACLLPRKSRNTSPPRAPRGKPTAHLNLKGSGTPPLSEGRAVPLVLQHANIV